MYQSQNRKGREILPSLSYHSNENNRQRYHNFILNMEDDILKSVTYGGHWRLPAPEKYLTSCILNKLLPDSMPMNVLYICKLNYYAPKTWFGVFGRQGRLRAPYSANWHFNQTCVIIRIVSIGISIYDTDYF